MANGSREKERQVVCLYYYIKDEAWKWARPGLVGWLVSWLIGQAVEAIWHKLAKPLVILHRLIFLSFLESRVGGITSRFFIHCFLLEKYDTSINQRLRKGPWENSIHYFLRQFQSTPLHSPNRCRVIPKFEWIFFPQFFLHFSQSKPTSGAEISNDIAKTVQSSFSLCALKCPSFWYDWDSISSSSHMLRIPERD